MYHFGIYSDCAPLNCDIRVFGDWLLWPCGLTDHFILFEYCFIGSNVELESTEPGSQSSWQAEECDKVVCGSCGATFPLTDTLLFIKHKQESCSTNISSENSQPRNDSGAVEINEDLLKAHGN